MNQDDDPGWGVPGWGLLLMFVPGALTYYVRRQQKTGADGLVMVRTLFLTFAGALVLYLIVLVLIGGGEDTDAAVAPWAGGLAAYGVFTRVVVRLIERPLNCESDATLAASYRTRFFLRLAFANAAALAGFVAVFMVGPIWLYLLTLVFAAASYARMAPTRSNLEADQQQLVQQACGRSLVAALRTNPATPS